MTDEEIQEILDALEAALADETSEALSRVADEFAGAVEDATELMAAVFRVSSVRDFWRRQVPRLMEVVRRITGRAAEAVAEGLGEGIPDIARELEPFEDAVQGRLEGVGDTLAAEAVRVLSEGLNAGEDVSALRERLLEAFTADGTHLGPGRAQRIAMTTATAAWNASSLAAAQALTGPARPLVKQWVTRQDTRVRPAHRDASGQLRLLDDPFDVDGVPMRYPGDPEAPAEMVIGCRCVMRVATADATACAEGRSPMTSDGLVAGADGSHYAGAMIALVPVAADARRLALSSGEPADQLHTTLFFLGEGADWDSVCRADLVRLVARAVRGTGPVTARAFGAAQWNPQGDSPCWVYNVGDHQETAGSLLSLRRAAQDALDGLLYGPMVPDQYSPWAPHICAVYSRENVSGDMTARCGDVTFDRVRLAFAGEEFDIPLNADLGSEGEAGCTPAAQADMQPCTPAYAEAVHPGMTMESQIYTWTTPKGTGLAFEGEQTGDGRLFVPGALHWSGGPWPLQYADEMNGGHDGARLAGPILTVGRDGLRITGTGGLYLDQDAGAEAAMLLAQGAPLGVSVDLDDVDLEFVSVLDGQTASLSVDCNACHGTTTTASAGADSSSSATNQISITAPAGADGLSDRGSGTSGSGIRGGFTHPVTPGSSGTAACLQTHAGAAEQKSSDGRHAFAVTAEATAGPMETRQPVAGTTSPAHMGSRDQRPNGFSPNKAESVPSVNPASVSSPKMVKTRPTSTTAMNQDVTGPSSVNPVTQESGSSQTTSDSSNALSHTCSRTSADEGVYRAHLLTASVLPLAGGGWALSGETAPEWTASGMSMVCESSKVTFLVGEDCTVPSSAFEIMAAAGDGDPGGTVLDRTESGAFLMRITRARFRGATLVTVPAFADARIVLDAPFPYGDPGEITADAADTEYGRVVRYVRKSLVPVTAADAALFLKLPITAVRRHLSRAAQGGDLVRISRGVYVRANGTEPVDEPEAMSSDLAIEGKSDCTTAAYAAMQPCTTAYAEDMHPDTTMDPKVTTSVTGTSDLPVADRETEWDGEAAEDRVFSWAEGDCGKIDKAFVYRDPEKDCTTKESRKLGVADVIGGELTLVPRGVFAAQAAVEGARGGVDIPAEELDEVKGRLMKIRAQVEEATGGEGMEELEASAWHAMKDLPPMPASWFAEPTEAELPPGAPGVNHHKGRIFGWVAQAGEPHAGYAQKVTIDGLGKIDTTHFLRQRFTLDDGSTVKAGAFTMNTGHHRDGAECETAACQFDDTRTVAGIVTVGMNKRGMWFSGAAAPWLAEWDRKVFMGCQPSYHLKKGRNGQWQLRAVLSVPEPGHSSPLTAAVVERSQLALAASAAGSPDPVHPEAVKEAENAVQAPPGMDYDRLADALVAALGRAEERKRDEAAEIAALRAEALELTASVAPTMTGDTNGTEEGS